MATSVHAILSNGIDGRSVASDWSFDRESAENAQISRDEYVIAPPVGARANDRICRGASDLANYR